MDITDIILSVGLLNSHTLKDKIYVLSLNVLLAEVANSQSDDIFLKAFYWPCSQSVSQNVRGGRGDPGAEPGHLPEGVQRGPVPTGAGRAAQSGAVPPADTRGSWRLEEGQRHPLRSPEVREGGRDCQLSSHTQLAGRRGRTGARLARPGRTLSRSDSPQMIKLRELEMRPRVSSPGENSLWRRPREPRAE